jgi:hypothetical protein
MAALPTKYPLAPQQETLWEFMKFFAPERPGDMGVTAVDAVWLRGPFDVDCLRRAVADLTARHDALRLAFVDSGFDPWLRIADRVAASVSLVDLSALEEDARVAEAVRRLAAAGDHAFDLERAPLWNVEVIQMAPQRHVVSVCLSHMIADGWSAQVFLHDLGRAYAARVGHGPPLPSHPAQYRHVLAAPHGGDRDGQLASYWRARLTPLPASSPYPVVDRSDRIDPTAEARLRFTLPDDVTSRLAGFAARARTTPFIVLLAAYRILLACRTGRHRLILGTTTLGRPGAGTRDLIGQFTTNTYVATTVSPETTLADVVGLVHRELTEAMRHATSFKRIARAVNPDFERNRPWPFMNLYDAWFQSDIPPRPPRFPGTQVEAGPPAPRQPAVFAPPSPDSRRLTEPRRFPVTTKRVTPWIIMDADCRSGILVYGPAFFTADLAGTVVREYQVAVRALLTEPDRRVGDLDVHA